MSSTKKPDGGIILIFATITALIWANSAFYDTYHNSILVVLLLLGSLAYYLKKGKI
ncbi:MAG: hypothetical protein DRI95_07305 [Bacteroidetes bacterium]|nr:MAG: hypothetical protein DRI95_07305 [Bacteroidota bacterium]